MNISFLGSAKEVGRSCILVEGKHENVLLDCGIKMVKNEEFPLLDNKTVKTIDKVVLSHAHLDHSGYLPALYAAGYKKKVLLTKPTRDLIHLLLADYLKLNKAACPFNRKDVETLLKNTRLLEYNSPSKEKKGYPITFREAGHILGSAITEVNAEKKIIYSGDFNLRSSRLLEGSASGLEGEILILESTYGGRKDEHLSNKDVGKMLVDSVNATLEKDGKVIIPTFAIGRGQEILFALENYLRSGGMKKCPVFLDGMITKALKIYRHNAIYLKREIQKRILTSDDDPFKSTYYQIPRTKDKADVFEAGKAVIITTSGMLNGGPVLHYLKKLGHNKKNKIILVGFQVDGSRGRALLNGAKELEIHGEQVEVNLEVDQARFSGHSDRRDLLKFTKSIKGLKKVFVNHGEAEKSLDLAEEIESKCKGVKAIVPELGQTIAL
ncbi:MAG: MBL fold metallo-hydrolase RNA specificity domain-containing protein [Candidatus Micrarchaeia archaeon]